MSSVNTSGTLTMTVGTDHTLATVEPADTCILYVNVGSLTGGTAPDIVEVREEVKVDSGDSYGLMDAKQLVGGQSQVRYATLPRLNAVGIRYIIKQVAGTGRLIRWAVHKP